MKVKNAVHQFKKMLQDAVMEDAEAKGGQGRLFSKYTV